MRYASTTALLTGVLVLGSGLSAWTETGDAKIGPPTICQPINIGDSKTIAGEDQSDQPLNVREVLALLERQSSALVRMETLRRATLRLLKDETKAQDLLSRLAFRAMDAEAARDDKASGRAFFDAGYLVACYDQIGIEGVAGCGRSENVNGYLWMQQALRRSGGDGEMEFGAALAAHPAMHRGAESIYRKHMGRARDAASKGSLLEKNVKTQEDNWSAYFDKK